MQDRYSNTLWLTLALVCLSCPAATNAPVQGIVAGPGSWHWAGVFCFNTFQGEEETKLHVVNVSHNPPQVVFETDFQSGIKPPICTSNAVIVIDTGGRIRKFSHDGVLQFDERIPKLSGICGLTGRLTDELIYVTETRVGKRGPGYHLHLLDIGGNKPHSRDVFRLTRLGPVVQYRGYLFVLGAKGSADVQVQKIKLPKGLGWFN